MTAGNDPGNFKKKELITPPVMAYLGGPEPFKNVFV